MVALGHSNEQVERETQVRHEMGRCNKLVDELSAVVGNIIASLSSVLASAQPPDKNLKDDSCEANFVPQWQKESAIKGVEFHMMNANAAPEGSHNSWLIEKAANGWKYGPVKDIEKKEHPCMVEYEQLPVAQQAKDYIFKAICDFFR